MKRAVGIAAIATLIGTSAWAADLPVKAPLPASAPAPAYNWTGFYLGGNAGGAWGNFDPSNFMPFVGGAGGIILADVNIYNSAVASQSMKPSGFTGGFQAGYNWQVNNVVLGLEGDIDSFNLKGSATTSGTLAGPLPFTATSSASTTWLATARGRLGLTADNWLFYGTGGAAFTTLKGNFGFTDAIGDFESAAVSNSLTGYAVGGGVEAGLWQQWSIRAEYLYVDFSRISTTGFVNGTQPVNHSIDLKANIVRIGLNYRIP